MKYKASSDNDQYSAVKKRLKSLGASTYVLSKAEVGELAPLLNENETIEAFIYGVHHSGWGMLVATNLKLLFVDKTFLDLKVEETPYSMVGEIEHHFGRVFVQMTIHTRSKNYTFKRVNRSCSRKFVDYVEDRMVDAQRRKSEREKAAQEKRMLQESMNYHLPTGGVERWVIN